jgi:hypothetical protein
MTPACLAVVNGHPACLDVLMHADAFDGLDVVWTVGPAGDDADVEWDDADMSSLTPLSSARLLLNSIPLDVRLSITMRQTSSSPLRDANSAGWLKEATSPAVLTECLLRACLLDIVGALRVCTDLSVAFREEAAKVTRLDEPAGEQMREASVTAQQIPAVALGLLDEEHVDKILWSDGVLAEVQSLPKLNLSVLRPIDSVPCAGDRGGV